MYLIFFSVIEFIIVIVLRYGLTCEKNVSIDALKFNNGSIKNILFNLISFLAFPFLNNYKNLYIIIHQETKKL